MADDGESGHRPLMFDSARRVDAVAGAYACCAALLALVAPAATDVGTLWPASGLLLGALILTAPPLRVRAAVLLGLAHALAGMVVTRSLVPPLLFGAILSGQAWLTVAQCQRFHGRLPRPDRLADFGMLVVRGGLVAGGVAGAAAALVAWMAFDTAFIAGWRDWWLREATDMLLVTPLVLSVAGWTSTTVGIRRAAEALLLGASLAASAGYIFFAAQPRIPLSVGVTPFLVWAALRFGVVGATAASLLLWEIAVFATQASVGPFVSLGVALPDRIARTHLYVLVTGGVVVVVAVVVAELQSVGSRLARSVTELRDAYARVQAIIASAPEHIAAIDEAYHLTGFNPAWSAEFTRLSGEPPTIGLDLRSRLQAIGTPWALAALDGWVRALAGEKLAVRRGPAVLGAPRELSVEYSPIRDDGGRTIGAMQLVRDVTDDQRRLEAAAQARRLESVGQLAGGIAHDFNNIVTRILSFAALLRQSMRDGDDRLADVREIERAAERAAELTAQLLAYARRQLVEPRIVDPNAQVEDAERLLRRLVGETLTFSLHLTPGVWPVHVDPTSLEQVLVNLAVNARDAMPGGGVLRLATSNVTLSADDLPQQASGPGDYVRLDVGDTGRGIAPEHLPRIFDPFFTTKDVGQGTGLGLASVFGILQRFGGAIGVVSRVGHGTTFSLYLPRASGEPGASGA